MSSSRPFSNSLSLAAFNTSFDSIFSPAPGFSSGMSNYSSTQPPVAMNQSFGTTSGHDNHYSLSSSMMMQSGHFENVDKMFYFSGKKLPSLRSLNNFSAERLNFMTESLWNGAEANCSGSKLNVSLASTQSDGMIFVGESDLSRSSTQILGHNKSFFGDGNGFNQMSITPSKRTELGLSYSLKKTAHTLGISSSRKGKKQCSYCKEDHQTKDKNGVTICPHLRALKCPICNNEGGDNGHTIR